MWPRQVDWQRFEPIRWFYLHHGPTGRIYWARLEEQRQCQHYFEQLTFIWTFWLIFCGYFWPVLFTYKPKQSKFSAKTWFFIFELEPNGGEQNDECHPSEWRETLPLEFLACLYARVLKSPFWAIPVPRVPFSATHAIPPSGYYTHLVLLWYSPVPSSKFWSLPALLHCKLQQQGPPGRWEHSNK